MYAVLVVKTERERKREWERERVRESVRASKSEREGDLEKAKERSSLVTRLCESRADEIETEGEIGKTGDRQQKDERKHSSCLLDSTST